VHNFFPDRWPVENTELDADPVDPAPTFEIVKRLGGYYYDVAFGKRRPDELYRISDDPEGRRNLASDLSFAPMLEELRARMMKLLREEADPPATGDGAVFDTYRYLDRERKDRPRSYDAWIKSREPEVDRKIKSSRQPQQAAPAR
jgi:N-sulfoglucosamine sulfohydrolase